MAQFEQCQETKVMRDPVHGYIHVHYQLIWDLINAKEFQRLRRIHQLGGTFQVYHTAEHSRFSHSLGVYEVVRLMIERVQGLKDNLSEREQVALLCAGLLHDVGHGPYSHSFEAVTHTDHEVFTDHIILENSDIHRILLSIDTDFPKLVADIIAHRTERKLLSQIISSQLDADRMDYLLRDSYFTGVSYGEFDLHRILRTLRLVDDQIVVKESGIHAVEDYIMARYQMYWQVYYHPVSRSFETILHSLFRRLSDLYQEQSPLLDGFDYFKPFLADGQVSLEDHYRLDESVCNAGFLQLQSSQDPILSDLSSRLLERRLFQYDDLKDENQIKKIKEDLKKKGYDPRYYLAKDFTTQILYRPYQEETESSIWVLKKDGSLLELSQASSIVGGFVLGVDKEDHKVFYP